MSTGLNRRNLFGAALAGAAVGAAGMPSPAAAQKRPEFRYCLNTSTISGCLDTEGKKLALPRMLEITAKAGYQAIEPWIRDIDGYVQAGGTLKELDQRIRDLGLVVEDAIGFPEWIVDDDARRAKGLEEARRAMDLVKQLGGKRIAAPPVGATDRSDLDLGRIAERYRALLELGDRMDVTPQLEIWGFSKTLNRLSAGAFVAIEANHPRACVLADVYHLHKGGSGFHGVDQLSGAAMQVFHMNDYPADPPPAQITDAHRVYPGDGVAPITSLLRDLAAVGFRGVLSLELFNRDYWKQDAQLVATTGLKKMKACVKAAMDSIR